MRRELGVASMAIVGAELQFTPQSRVLLGVPGSAGCRDSTRSLPASLLSLSGGDTRTGDEAGGRGCGHLLGKGESISILRTGTLCLMPPSPSGPLPHSVPAQTWSQPRAGGAFLTDRQTDRPP